MKSGSRAAIIGNDMTEFIDKSAILGTIPRAEHAAVESQRNNQDNQETDDSAESDDSGQDQAEVNASDEELESEESQEDSEESGDTGEEDQAGDDSGQEDWKHKFEVAERDRRDWQSKANASDSDNSKLLDALKSTPGNGAQNQGVTSAPKQSGVFDRLDSMGEDDLISPADLKSILGEFKNEQQAEQQATQQITQLDDFNGRMNSALGSKTDLKEVTEFYKQNLARDPETQYMTELGLYYYSLSKMQEAQTKEAFNKGTVEGAKNQEGRKKRLNKIPGVTGSQGKRETRENEPSGLLDIMTQRRKDRGIKSDGNIH